MTVSRRRFLQAASVTLPALVVGIHLPFGRAAASEASAPSSAGLANAWLAIAPDETVTVSLCQAEMGQDVYTTMAMLIAEELEADWSKIKVASVLANPIYANATLHVQGTFGSASIRDFNVPLRTAGAQAREMLRAAAARQWNVPLDACIAERGAIVHAKSGRKLTYGALAANASKLPAPEDIALKAPKDWKILGRPTSRLDVKSKVNGSAVYGIDVNVPNMLVGTVRACPQFGGKLKSLDDKPALAIRGVHSVVKLENAFIVLADSYWPAHRGAEALQPVWEAGPLAGFTSEELSRQLHQKLEQPGLVAVNQGDAAATLASASRRLEATYEVPYLAHVCMEPMNGTVSVTAEGIDAWLPTQFPGLNQIVLAQMFGFKLEQVRVRTTFLGGGFGRRGEQDFVLYAALASKASGRPVKVIWRREEDIQHDVYRPATVGRLRAALDESGAPIALDLRLVLQSIGARLAPPSQSKDMPRLDAGGTPSGAARPDPFAVTGLEEVPYRLPHWHADYVEQQQGAPVGAWRSVPNSYNGFFIESFIDEIAHAAKRDPAELRRALLSHSARHAAVLEKALAASGWRKPAPNRSRGLSFFSEAGTLVCQVAEISVDKPKQLHVHRVTAVVDCGRALNPRGVEAQIQGAILDGLSAMMYGEITLDDGRVQQSNFHTYPMLRLPQAPTVDVHIIDSGAPLSGIGEPAVPGVAPAIANAIFAATGERIRKLPMVKSGYSLV